MERRDTYLKYIGGQSKVFCEEHDFPLIYAAFNRKCKCLHIHGEGLAPCQEPVFLECPHHDCLAHCCKPFFVAANEDEHVQVPIVVAAAADNVGDDLEQDNEFEPSDDEEQQEGPDDFANHYS